MSSVTASPWTAFATSIRSASSVVISSPGAAARDHPSEGFVRAVPEAADQAHSRPGVSSASRRRLRDLVLTLLDQLEYRLALLGDHLLGQLEVAPQRGGDRLVVVGHEPGDAGRSQVDVAVLREAHLLRAAHGDECHRLALVVDGP